MNLKNKYIDELLHLRVEAREKKNWELSDKIRKLLDDRCVFVFDTDNGPIVYHKKDSTREKLILQLKKETRAQKLFEAWLHSVNGNLQRKALSL